MIPRADRITELGHRSSQRDWEKIKPENIGIMYATQAVAVAVETQRVAVFARPGKRGDPYRGPTQPDRLSSSTEKYTNDR